MNQIFDKYNLYEIPGFFLCQPSGEELFSLGGIFDRRFKPRYNSLSELSFVAPYQIDGVKTDYYPHLLYKKLVLLEDIGYFMITNVSETNDGKVRQKEVTCQSLEVELCSKRVTTYSGTKQFYDFISPSATLIGEIMTYIPDWTVGSIDSELTTLYRTFDVSDTSLYNLLMTTVEDSYQCIFYFDYLNKTVNAYAIGSAITPTDVYLSHDNLIEKLDIKEVSDELVTALTVKGGGNLSIAQVNPIGSDVLYNFTYYKTLDWMTQDLIDAITAWEAKVLEKQGDYADLLTLLKDNNETLITLQSELAELTAELKSLEGVMGARIQAGIDYSDISAQISAKNSEIASKQAEIDSVYAIIGVADSNGVYPDGSLMKQLKDINTYVSFASNFTSAQQIQLSHFIVGNTYNNENFIQTDIMTQAEIQDQAQALFDQGVAVLAKVSVPRYEFTVDSVNFMFLKDFSVFIDQIELGSSVTLELDEDTFIYPVLLGMDLNYDDPTDFTLTFGNRLRLDDSSYTFTDLFGQAVNNGVSTSFNSEQWGNWNRNYKDEVSTFITSALDASLNTVISGSTQNVLIDQNGLRGRSSIDSTHYDPQQVWLVNNMLAFTDDNWSTAKLALGRVNSSSGSSFGLVAETVVGRLIAGNNLTITNDSATFTVNSTGATLTNATMTINTTNGKSKILLDPTNGIKIQGLTGGSWEDKFYADSNGNLTFKGALSGATGTFSGTLSAATITGGTITGTTINGGTINGATGYFSGNVYAANLQGLVTSDQINSLLASKVAAGTMSNVNLSGGRGSITVGGAGQMLISAGSNGMSLDSGYLISIAGTETDILSPLVAYGSTSLRSSLSVSGTSNFYGVAYFNAGLSTTGIYSNAYYASGYLGQNYSAVLRTYAGGRIQLNFTNGILTSIS